MPLPARYCMKTVLAICGAPNRSAHWCNSTSPMDVNAAEFRGHHEHSNFPYEVHYLLIRAGMEKKVSSEKPNRSLVGCQKDRIWAPKRRHGKTSPETARRLISPT